MNSAVTTFSPLLIYLLVLSFRWIINLPMRLLYSLLQQQSLLFSLSVFFIMPKSKSALLVYFTLVRFWNVAICVCLRNFFLRYRRLGFGWRRGKCFSHACLQIVLNDERINA